MPQMNKGGKWVFGWCVIGVGREIRIPLEAFVEYGFQAGEPVIFLRGSRRSGGFSLGRLEKLAGTNSSLLRRSLGNGAIGSERRVAIPAEMDIQLGERLLAVRGSGYAVLFLRHGPIFEAAANHPEIEVFVANP
jgi:hypothetical protein